MVTGGVLAAVIAAASVYVVIRLTGPAGDTASAVSPTAAPSGTAASPTASNTPVPSVSPSPSAALGCSSGTNVADGRDPFGGCWPGPNTTGVPAGVNLVKYDGPCTISRDGTVISAKLVKCDLQIRAANVVIEKSHIDGTVYAEISNASFTVTDSTVNASPEGIRQTTGVGQSNFTLRRTEVIGGNRGVYCHLNCTIVDSWIHGQKIKDDWHASAVRMGERTTITHNTMVCDAPVQPDPEGSCSATLTGYGDFTPIRNNAIRHNLFLATAYAAYCAYGGSTKGKPHSGQTSNIVFDNNVFQKGKAKGSACALYGPIGDYDPAVSGNAWTNNRFDDGTVIPSKRY
ncbi:hypothetical protein Rhe02_18910 [Rhizocola hellebori]|uniref:Uncharacterized protein n=1 Tax=Rhizocola hellebori TaxID=1392758 RepID=A0A8J3Q4U3_9ACTN|nr:hypothetical protein Rhe02_18910 [Rhizocola hellebori]